MTVAMAVPKLTNGQFAWWTAGDTGARTLPAHVDCIHRKYRLTCAQYETLIERSGGACEVCGTSAGDMTMGWRCVSGRLHIDHDHTLGLWAVRGLLCRRCNNTIDQWFRSGQLNDYDANAYHRKLVADSGAIEGEPEVGVVVRDFAYREWRRMPDGWVALHSQAWQFEPVVTWDDLIFISGPHNLTVCSAPDLQGAPG